MLRYMLGETTRKNRYTTYRLQTISRDHRLFSLSESSYKLSAGAEITKAALACSNLRQHKSEIVPRTKHLDTSKAHDRTVVVTQYRDRDASDVSQLAPNGRPDEAGSRSIMIMARCRLR